MKAQTLSICLPGTACDKQCPYCVSKMTWAPPVDVKTWNWNLPKVSHFARMAQVTDVIITGKGEPSSQNEYLSLFYALSEFRDWPVVIQTNGKAWSENPKALDGFTLMSDGKPQFNIISVSIDDPDQMQKYAGLWEKVNSCPVLTARITVMLTPEVCKLPFNDWVDLCKTHGIRGLSFREITIPKDYVHTKQGAEVARWIQGLDGNKVIMNWRNDFEAKFSPSPTLSERALLTCLPEDPRIIRRLPYGAVIKDFDGISVTKFEYCIQDSSGEDDIRSLVYNQDGHLYTTWSSPASLIF